MNGDAGGLAGDAHGPIADSYATGNVEDGGSGAAGGLVGSTNFPIDRSFATGRVHNGSDEGAGGLVGQDTSTVANSYATGALVGASNSGGLVGFSTPAAAISSSYATGNVISGAGGFACYINQSQVSNNYWDTTTSGTTYGECQNTNISGVTGLTTTQFQSGLAAGFDPKIWAQDRKINRGFPYLIANPPPQ